MNYTDILVISIILLLSAIGFLKGLINSLFKLLSFFIALIVSIKCAPIVSKVFINTPFFEAIKTAIATRLMMQQGANSLPSGGTVVSGSQTSEAMLQGLKLPNSLNGLVGQRMSEYTGVLNVEKIIDSVSTVLAEAIISIISMVVLFIVIRIILFIVRTILSKVTKLPVLKQINSIGGLVFGAAEGVLTVYIVFLVLTLFTSSSDFANAIDNSLIAKFFYHNNLIANFIFL